ncbi:transcriptional regulator [Cronobacter phage SG01]|nr:transcriptional regulator [Cronobacter phage SG01]
MTERCQKFTAAALRHQGFSVRVKLQIRSAESGAVSVALVLLIVTMDKAGTFGRNHAPDAPLLNGSHRDT